MTDEQRIEEALLLRRAKFDRNDNPKVFSAWSWRDGVAWRDANPKPVAESDEKLRERRNKNIAQVLAFRLRDLRFEIGEEITTFWLKGQRCLIDTKNVDIVLGERGPILYPSGPVERRTFYVGIEVNSPDGGHKRVPIHRLILARKLGRDDFDMCDHINSERFDNREVNLRPATATENARNSRRKVNGKYKYRGVLFKKGRWSAQISVDGVSFHLGTYDTEIEAAIAYNEAAREKHGEFAKLNEF